MPRVNCVVEAKISSHPRVRQLEGMFDVPRKDTQVLAWEGDVPIEEREWAVGCIVGPSGCGKTTIAHQLFHEELTSSLAWEGASVVECFDEKLSMQKIVDVCRAVGFNTVPAWMRPYNVLSTGEKFRVTLARKLAEGGPVVVVDEFTSVVDRQVAKVGSHAVQKYIRRGDQKFVAVTCHYDVIDWLQPDWVLEPVGMSFRWRSLRRRPKIQAEIYRATHKIWPQFAPYHYLTASLSKAAKCFVLAVDKRPVAFIGLLHMPISRAKRKLAPIWSISRSVVVPDYQGMGVNFIFKNFVASLFAAAGMRVRSYPAHPSFIRSIDRSPEWALKKKPGAVREYRNRSVSNTSNRARGSHRPCAIFEYVGAKYDDEEFARAMIA